MKIKQKLLGIAGFVMVLFLGLVMYPSTQVRADYIGAFQLKNGFAEEAMCSPGDQDGYYRMSLKSIRLAICKDVNVTSSNPSAAAVEYDRAEEVSTFRLIPRKKGVTRIKVTAIRNGKKVSCQGIIRVVEFKSPFQSLKVNGEDCSDEVTASSSTVNIKASKFRLNYKLRSGWKVSRLSGKIENTNQDGGGNKFTFRMIQKGKLVSLKDGYVLRVYLNVKNKKTGQTMTTMFVVNL